MTLLHRSDSTDVADWRRKNRQREPISGGNEYGYSGFTAIDGPARERATSRGQSAEQPGERRHHELQWQRWGAPRRASRADDPHGDHFRPLHAVGDGEAVEVF